ncbi:MAG: hypothetical protein L0Y62_00525, partial [Nitrospirae bacterium]|nr:hypothetical protein [Nitrospirota bacterium]
MRKISVLLMFSVLSLILMSCGGGGGGSNVDAGVIVDAVITPEYLDANTDNVDAFRIADCDVTTPALEPEPFTDHSATVVFTARLINPSATVSPGPIYITRYTIRYYKSADSLSAPPIQVDARL